MKKIWLLVLVGVLSFGLMAGCATQTPAGEASSAGTEETTAPEGSNESTASEEASAAQTSEPPKESAETQTGEEASGDGPAVKSTSGFEGEIESAPIPEAEGLTIGYCGIGSFEVSWLQLGNGVKAGVEFHNATFKDYNPTTRFDVAEQIAQMENAIADGVDAIVLAPCDGAAVTSVIEKADAAGIPIITMNIAAESDLVTSHVSNDDYAAGMLSADYIAEKAGEKGNVVLIAGDDTLKSGYDRRVGFEEGIAKYPEMEIVVNATTAWDAAAAQNAMVAALDSYDDIVGVFACWDAGTLAAYQAIVDAGREADGMTLAGVDAYNDALILIRDGSIFQSDIYKDLTFQGYLAAETAIKAALGETLPDFIDSGYLQLTAENIQDWMKEYDIDLEQKKADEEEMAAQYS